MEIPLEFMLKGDFLFSKTIVAAKTGLSRDDIVSLANVNKGRNVTFWPFRRLFAPLHRRH